MVARVAERLQRGLVESGKTENPPDRDLVIAGALLHDIAKTKCLEERCKHAEVGALFCNEIGYPQIGEIVANHVILTNFRHESYRSNTFNAMELVFYADKRVRHDEVVTLNERLEYILSKYGNNSPEQDELIVKNFNKCTQLEDYLFASLPFCPDDIADLLTVIPEGLHYYPPELP